jgi:beta-mannanase
MSSFKKTFKRLFNVIIALSAGYLIVYGFAAISKRSKGPLGGFLENVSDMVQDIEHDAILGKRETLRENRLSWFTEERKNKNALLKSKFVLFGASDDSKGESYENIINLEDSLALTFPIIHIYKAWGENPEYKFPKNEVDAINRIGSVPMITWEPWLAKFSQENFPNIQDLERRDKNGLTSVANGDYDTFLKEWAWEAQKVDYPIYLRLGHEMNDPYRYPWGPQNNDPSEYVAAYKHVRDVFEKVGAKNIIWVWSPHLSYGKFKEYYPGFYYVDVVASGALNYGTSTSWSDWWTFEQIFGNYYKDLAIFNKPIMIAEFGSLKPGGNRAEWFGNAFENFHENYPLVTSIIFFHYSSDPSTTYKDVSWYFRDDEEVTTEIKKQLKKWDPKIKQPGIE